MSFFVLDSRTCTFRSSSETLAFRRSLEVISLSLTSLSNNPQNFSLFFIFSLTFYVIYIPKHKILLYGFLVVFPVSSSEQSQSLLLFRSILTRACPGFGGGISCNSVDNFLRNKAFRHLQVCWLFFQLSAGTSSYCQMTILFLINERKFDY